MRGIQPTPEYIAFIDYEKGFDSVESSTAILSLRDHGVDDQYGKILQDIYSGSTASIALHKESNKTSNKKGIRQGDTISPTLFTACLQEVLTGLD